MPSKESTVQGTFSFEDVKTEGRRSLDRRAFMKLSAVLATAGATGGLASPRVLAQDRRRQEERPPLPPPPNSVSPCIQFQAVPGGTGAYLQRLLQEGGGEYTPPAAIEVAKTAESLFWLRPKVAAYVNITPSMGDG